MKKDTLLKKVGEKIKSIRESKNITQLQLVIKIEELEGKIDTTNISRIESGRTNPTIYTLYRISSALDVPLNSLLEIDLEN